MNYIVYDEVTGEILRSGSCPAFLIAAQKMSKDEKVLRKVKADDRTHKIEKGKVVKKKQR